MSYEMAQHLTFIIQGCFSIWLLIDGTSIIGFGRKVLKNQRQTNTPMSCILISHLSSLISHLYFRVVQRPSTQSAVLTSTPF